MKKRIVLLLVTVLMFTVLFVVLYKKNKKATPKVTVGNRVMQKLTLTKNATYNFNNPPHRILPFGDSLVILIDTNILISNNTLTYKRTVPSPFKTSLESFYYMPLSASAAVGFDASENRLYTQTNTKTKSIKSDEILINAIWLKDKFYAYNTSKKQVVTIDIWDTASNEFKTKLNVSALLKDSIKSNKNCYLQTLEGNFFSIDENNIGFYFYRGGKFLLINADTTILVNSIVQYPFIEFYTKKLKLANGLEVESCEPTKDLFVQMCACSDSKKIYILSSLTKGRSGIIDIYSKSGIYEKSFELPEFGNKQIPTAMLVANKNLFVVFGNDLFSYKIEGL